MTLRTECSKVYHSSHFSVLTKETLAYVGRFSIGGLDESETVLKVAKVGPNVAFLTKAKIGFARFQDGKQ